MLKPKLNKKKDRYQFLLSILITPDTHMNNEINLMQDITINNIVSGRLSFELIAPLEHSIKNIDKINYSIVSPQKELTNISSNGLLNTSINITMNSEEVIQVISCLYSESNDLSLVRTIINHDKGKEIDSTSLNSLFKNIENPKDYIKFLPNNRIGGSINDRS